MEMFPFTINGSNVENKSRRQIWHCLLHFGAPFFGAPLLFLELMKYQNQASGRNLNLVCNETKESKMHILLLSYEEKTIKKIKEQIALCIVGYETITRVGRWRM